MSDDVNTYQSGSTILLTQEYVDRDGAALDPTTVELRTKDPVGTVATQSVDRAAVGKYTCEFVVDVAGHWVYEWKTTGGSSTSIGDFDVLPSPIDDPNQSLIARQVNAMMPRTWEALAGADYYGPAMLAGRIEIAKNIALPAVLVSQDESALSPLMREYIATLAGIEIGTAGIEYWMSQKISISTTGTNETTSYTDRQLAFLRGIIPALNAKAARLAANPAIAAGLAQPGELPVVSGNDDGVLVTTNPYDFPPAFSDADSSATGGGE